MRKTILTIMLVCGALAAQAIDGALDGRSRMTLLERQGPVLEGPQSAKCPPLKQLAKSKNGVSDIIGAVVRLVDGYEAADLEAEGVKVYRQRGRMAIVSMPIDDVERVAALPSVQRLSLERELKPMMNIARYDTGIDTVHAGGTDDQPLCLPYTDTQHQYKGNGVAVGVFDQGIDPNHCNFRNADGSSRFSFFEHLTTNSATKEVEADVRDASTIGTFTTDDTDTFHGTHTLGILGGGYTGNITAVYCRDIPTDRWAMGTVPNPFYGVAPEATLMAGCGSFSDANLLRGVEDMIEHAKSIGQPAVINMSLGYNVGDHNKLSPFNVYLDSLASEAIVCISAGNEGETNLSAKKTLTQSDKTLKTVLKGVAYNRVAGSGTNTSPYVNPVSMQINTTSSQVPTLNLCIFDTQSNAMVASSELTVNVSDGNVRLIGSTGATTGVTVWSEFDKHFTGLFQIWGETSADTGCGYIFLYGQYWGYKNTGRGDKKQSNTTSRYQVAIEVTGHESGEIVEALCDGNYVTFSNYSAQGWTNGSDDGSINDLAFGDNIISVGSYNTNVRWGRLDGYFRSYNTDAGYEKGGISPFSSYGTCTDGSTLPTVCAPGAMIISSANQYYIEEQFPTTTSTKAIENEGKATADDIDANVSAKVTANGRDNYWMESQGTSMACPLAAGVVALWLEADPTLDAQDVKTIMAETSRRDSLVNIGKPAQWGDGKIDAYAGIKKVIQNRTEYLTGVSAPAADTADGLMVRWLGSGSLELFMGGASCLTATLYDLQGRVAFSASALGDTLMLDTSGLPHGIYLLRCGTASRKLVL